MKHFDLLDLEQSLIPDKRFCSILFTDNKKEVFVHNRYYFIANKEGHDVQPYYLMYELFF